MSSHSGTFTSFPHRLGVARVGGPRFPRACAGIGALSVLLTLVTLTFTATSALANSAEGFSHTLGEGPGSQAGELELAAPVRALEGAPYFAIAGSGVAVNDETHDVYVADTGNHRVDEFESNGTFLRAFGKNVGGPGIDTCMLVPGCKAGTEGSEPGALAAPKFVAVDNSGGESEGDVYVGIGVGSEARNERQLVEIDDATEGTFTLSFEGETTRPIAYSDVVVNNPEDKGPNAVAARGALEDLVEIGSGNVKVTEVGDDPSRLTVEFIEAKAEAKVSVLSCAPSGLLPPGAKCQVKVEREGSPFAGEVISKFTAAGALIETWGDSTPTPNGQLTGSSAGKGPFKGKLEGIAVDSVGDLWVLDEGGMYEFEQSGKFVQNSSLGQRGSASGLAVDGAGNLYAVGLERPCVEELGHGCVSAEHDPDPTGFALNTSTQDLFADLGGSVEHASGTCVSAKDCEVFGSSSKPGGGSLSAGAGVAVDSSTADRPVSGSVYVADTSIDEVDAFGVVLEAESGSASELKATTATVSGTVDPEGSEIGECKFEYGTNAEYEEAPVPCEEKPEAIGSGTSSIPVSAKLEHLRGGTAYHFRLVVTKGASTVAGDDRGFSTSSVPVVTGAEARHLTIAAGAGGVEELSAELRASVNPEGVPVKHCEFEYVEAAKYKASALDPYVEGRAVRCQPPASLIGEGSEPVPVSVRLTGLSPDVTYYWKLKVSDENGEAVEPGHTFVYPTAGSELPDGRAYEMVTPPEKNGASVGDVYAGSYDIAEDGQRVIVPSIQCFGGARSCTANRNSSTGELWQIARTGEAGACAPAAPPCWVTTALAPPASEFSASCITG